MNIKRLAITAFILLVVMAGTLPVMENVSAQSAEECEELSYDDGNAEFGFPASKNVIGAVLFHTMSTMGVTKLRFYTWGDMIPVKVCILNSSHDIIFSQIVTPTPGWDELDVSQENILTDEDFYVGWCM